MNDCALSGKTRICGIIGDPIEHSLSPAMQNAAFRELGLDYIYIPFKVNEANLVGAIDGIRTLNFAGVNVTIPHKVAVLSCVDEIDGLAEHIGAVNTIINREGVLKGYNTDASGFYHTLIANNVTVSNKKIVVLGAGGAARAVVFVLADKGAEITLLNRSPAPAGEIAGRVFQAFRTEIKVGELTTEDLKVALEEADLLVNTTNLGMAPFLTETPVAASLLKKRMVVFDIIYNPLKTRLLIEAEEKGLRVINGLEMLVRQGADAFELWTGQKAPVEIMRKAAGDALRHNEK
jgi:shikimate dehydrogenase